MSFENSQLCEALNSVTAIPIIPFAEGGRKVDYAAHQKNISYLMRNNYLSEGRPRVIALAGTSLIHHVTPDEQMRLIEATGEVMGSEGLLISGIVPNPIWVAAGLIEKQSQLKRPPDAYLIMPLGGVYSPEGMYETYLHFADMMGSRYGARLLYYFRKPADRDCVIQLLKESPHFIGVKVGTSEADVQPLIDGIGDRAMVIWGIGDRSTGRRNWARRAIPPGSPWWRHAPRMRSTTPSGAKITRPRGRSKAASWRWKICAS